MPVVTEGRTGRKDGDESGGSGDDEGDDDGSCKICFDGDRGELPGAQHPDDVADADASSHVFAVSAKSAEDKIITMCSVKSRGRADADTHASDDGLRDVMVGGCVACAGARSDSRPCTGRVCIKATMTMQGSWLVKMAARRTKGSDILAFCLSFWQSAAEEDWRTAEWMCQYERPFFSEKKLHSLMNPVSSVYFFPTGSKKVFFQRVQNRNLERVSKPEGVH